MHPRTVLPTLLCLSVLAAGARSAAPAFPPFAIAHSQVRPLPPSAGGRHYELAVHLPASYAQNPGRRYPVLYVTDGYWDFPTVVVSYDNMTYDRAIPEFIIVGLGYAGRHLDYNDLRRWELTPVPLARPGGPSGHAADFLRGIKEEIIPLVEHAAALARSGRPLKARLYFTTAENEWPDFRAGIERFHDQLAGYHYPGFVFQFRRIDGMRHAGEKAESYARGMAFVFAPEAPESGPMQDHPY